jgi:molecular chaperone GrpE
LSLEKGGDSHYLLFSLLNKSAINMKESDTQAANSENKTAAEQQDKPKSKVIDDILKTRRPSEDAAASDANGVSTEEFEKAKQEAAQYKDQALRLAAEIENLRKRNQRDLEEEKKYAITKFARELIEVLENLYRAESSINTEELDKNPALKQIFSGVELTKKSLIDAFEKFGIKRIDPVGEIFNHDLHQAITQVPSKTHKDGEIVQVIQAGYTLNDRLLRPALVAVAKFEVQ